MLYTNISFKSSVPKLALQPSGKSPTLDVRGREFESSQLRSHPNISLKIANSLGCYRNNNKQGFN